MSSLTAAEKSLFEDLFEMSGGYVLEFNNPTFAELFRSSVGVDIDTQKYHFNGNSKAKRLRAFWEIEPDHLVGKVLSELLDVWKYNNLKCNVSGEDLRYQKCLKITGRLLGKEVSKEDPETQFLKKDFGEISFDKIPLDASLITVLEGRLLEANLCLECGASLSVIFLCGSILEGLLLGVASRNPCKFNKADSSPKARDSGKVKAFPEWKLAEMIDVAYEIGFLKLDVKKFSHEMRHFRNYIHPHMQMQSQFNPDKHTAKICLQVLKAAIASLSGER